MLMFLIRSGGEIRNGNINALKWLVEVFRLATVFNEILCPDLHLKELKDISYCVIPHFSVTLTAL